MSTEGEMCLDELTTVEDCKKKMKVLEEELAQTLESASAISQQSRKRIKLLEWEDVLLTADLEYKPIFVNLSSPEIFSERDREGKLAILRLANMEQHLDLINDTIAELMGISVLPSPSNMTWAEVRKILHGTVPDSDDEMMVSMVSPSPITNVQDVMKKVEELVNNTTEMEATVRVVLFVVEAAWGLENIKIRLQPSVLKHPVFTDFLFIFNGNVITGFVEVKKTDISTDLSLTTKSTAQALREAHILTLEHNLNVVIIALTNSVNWSFGKAVKYGVQVKIDKTVTLRRSAANHGKIITMLTHLMKGKWPEESHMPIAH